MRSHFNTTRLIFATLLLSLSGLTSNAQDTLNAIDSTIMLGNVEVTALKQGNNLYSAPIASTVLNQQEISNRNITDLTDISDLVPNLFIPDYGSRITSAIYVRGMGARMDQPVMGLNIDNVPILSKDNYDFEMVDIDRIEVLRGPQSTMYGRNTMGGVMNIYTISPLSYSGTRLGLEYGTGNTIKANASHYFKVNQNLGMAITGYYSHTDGFFTNTYNNEDADYEDYVGGRFKTQWRGDKGLSIDNTFAVSHLNQGINPYEQVAKDGVKYNEGKISYNDPLTYERLNISNGLTIKQKFDKFSVAGITSYQFSDSDFALDNDFTENNWMTVNQSTKEHNITEDIVVKSSTDSKYQWLVGAFGFYKDQNLVAPSTFKSDGINDVILSEIRPHLPPVMMITWGEDNLILDASFGTATHGMALYHQSDYTVGKWNFSVGARLDYEYSKLNYTNTSNGTYNLSMPGTPMPPVTEDIKIDNNDHLSQSFIEVLPKISIQYQLKEHHSFYASLSKGYKAGGFNIQMFPLIMQEQLKKQMMGRMGEPIDIHDGGRAEDLEGRVIYDPEYSWNYEVGANLWWRDAGIKANFALFYIDCKDQQISVIPKGAGSFGRLTTNAGESRSFGAEVALSAEITEKLLFSTSYGYTNAKFTEYYDDGVDYSGNYIPFAPQHTISARLSYTVPVKADWLQNITFNAGTRGAGEIYWEEDNAKSQPFYALLDCSVKLENENVSLNIWGRNMTNNDYETFYFASMGYDFVQRGKPSNYGVTLNYKF